MRFGADYRLLMRQEHELESSEKCPKSSFLRSSRSVRFKAVLRCEEVGDAVASVILFGARGFQVYLHRHLAERFSWGEESGALSFSTTRGSARCSLREFKVSTAGTLNRKLLTHCYAI